MSDAATATPTPQKEKETAFTLRAWTEADAESCAAEANSARVAQYLRDAFPHPYSVDDARAFIAFCRAQDPARALMRCIDVGGRAVGSISVAAGTDVYARSAELGFWLGEAHWGRGTATRAVRQVCAAAFAALGVVRVHAEVFAPNAASHAVLRRAGFVCEGVHRRAVYKNGVFYDTHTYALVKDP